MSQMISILLPTHNEELFIEKSLNSLLKNDYDKNMFEILVIDGMSTDKTLEITNRKHINDSRIKIISNDKIIFPAAINLGIKHAKGDIIVIVGAHAKYPKNYLTECVNGLNKYKADNVGGILETRSLKTTTLSKLIIASLSSSFGVGNSTFRVGSAEAIEVDTVFGGCYRKEVFDKYGNFNENLISSSDMEFNKRITKAGAKIILLPWIKVIYYTRTKFINFIKNNI
ncbi:MAG: glycosyltransferase family 2 protein, partial [Bacteroidetes bacterium]|nr:glycosyltransferase family 2 protein [Bacteroidota bacterium]